MDRLAAAQLPIDDEEASRTTDAGTIGVTSNNSIRAPSSVAGDDDHDDDTPPTGEDLEVTIASAQSARSGSSATSGSPSESGRLGAGANKMMVSSHSQLSQVEENEVGSTYATPLRGQQHKKKVKVDNYSNMSIDTGGLGLDGKNDEDGEDGDDPENSKTGTTATNATSDTNGSKPTRGGKNGTNGDDPDPEAVRYSEGIPANWPVFNPLEGPYPLWVYKKDWVQVKNEILVGLVVGCGQVPESIAFAFLAGVDASVGLHAAWIIGMIVSLTGNRPGLISGATGAMAVILRDPIKQYGVKYLFYTVIFKGIIQTAVSFMGFEKVANLVPFTVNLGFVNGLAIIIGSAQIQNFSLDGEYVTGWTLFAMICLSLVTFAIIMVLPKLTKVVPSSLVGILVCTMIEHLILRPSGMETILIGDVSSLKGGFPALIYFDNRYKDELPSLLDAKTWEIITPPAILTALVAMIECVMTIEVIDDLTQTPHLPVTQQLASAGVANFVSGFFGTMGGGATIPLSMIAVHSGANGRYRISGFVGSIFMLTTILVASPLLELVPSSALIGVMMIAVLRTFQFQSVWIVLVSMLPMKARKYLREKVSSFKKFEDFTTDKKIGRSDAMVIVAVTILTLIFDLAIAVVFGTLFSCFWYVWQHSKMCKITSKLVEGEEREDDVVVYTVDGPLFFGNAHWIRKQFNFKEDPCNVEIHLTDAHIYDYSAMQALNFVGEKYKKFDKRLKLKNINRQSKKLIAKAKDLFLNFEYEELVAVETNRDLKLTEPARLKVM